MTVLVTADFHLNDNPRDEYRHLWQEELRTLVRTYAVDQLFILGDITDEKDHHSSYLVNRVVEYLRELATRCFITILTGNHDYIDPAHPFFEFTSTMNRVRWINTPTYLSFADKGLGQCLFLPHTRDYKADWATIDWDMDIVFAHNTFKGARAASDRELDGIPLGVIPKDTTVISGDVHVPQDVGNVTYVGAPYSVDFGDHYKPRVLLLKDDRMKSVPCKGPQKRLIKAANLEQAITKLPTVRGDIVKVRLAWDSTQMEKWAVAKRTLIDAAHRDGVTLHSIEPVLDATVSRKRYKASGKSRSDTEILTEYCAHNSVNKDLTKVGMRIVKP